jgi:hypothetical protein
MTEDNRQEADYHDAHLDDPQEWGTDAPEEATVRPSGMTVFSMRLANAELDAIRAAAQEHGTTMSEVIRAAVRSYLRPPGTWVSFSGNFQPQQPMTKWEGGRSRTVVAFETSTATVSTERSPS